MSAGREYFTVISIGLVLVETELQVSASASMHSSRQFVGYYLTKATVEGYMNATTWKIK